MKKNSTWNDLLKPVVVLTAICVVVSAALAAVNGVTAPIIAEAAAKAADAARIELLPEADGFEQVEVAVEGVTEMYKATNDAGYVISAQGNGYGGNGSVKLMIAYDNTGVITNAKVIDCAAETPGIGDKIVKESWFMEQFLGQESVEFVKGDNVDAISGTTISSGAAISAMNAANKAFNEVVKGVVVVELTFEEELALYFGEMTAAEVTHEDVVEAYTCEKGTVLVVNGSGYGKKGDHASGLPLKVYVSFDEAGVITGLMIDAASETPGLGDQVEAESFTSKLIGATDGEGCDTIAGATVSSKGVKSAVNKAAAAFAAING